jgi:hypothetical protein
MIWATFTLVVAGKATFVDLLSCESNLFPCLGKIGNPAAPCHLRMFSCWWCRLIVGPTGKKRRFATCKCYKIFLENNLDQINKKIRVNSQQTSNSCFSSIHFHIQFFAYVRLLMRPDPEVSLWMVLSRPSLIGNHWGAIFESSTRVGLLRIVCVCVHVFGCCCVRLASQPRANNFPVVCAVGFPAEKEQLPSCVWLASQPRVNNFPVQLHWTCTVWIPSRTCIRPLWATAVKRGPPAPFSSGIIVQF